MMISKHGLDTMAKKTARPLVKRRPVGVSGKPIGYADGGMVDRIKAKLMPKTESLMEKTERQLRERQARESAAAATPAATAPAVKEGVDPTEAEDTRALRGRKIK